MVVRARDHHRTWQLEALANSQSAQEIEMDAWYSRQSRPLESPEGQTVKATAQRKKTLYGDS